MDDAALISLLHDAADAVRRALDQLADWSPLTERPGQYSLDLVADEAVLGVLDRAGVGVLSEESGLRRPDHDMVVVVDPVDGSTNASRRVPWYATSLCAVDADGPRAALVVNQASDERFEAFRGGGATLAGATITASKCAELSDALVLLNGLPDRHLGWRQFRALGAASLDLCAVAAGRVDGFVDCVTDTLGPWDYLGGALICAEAGAAVDDLHGRPLLSRAHADRRTVLAASTPTLLEQLRTARQKIG